MSHQLAARFRWRVTTELVVALFIVILVAGLLTGTLGLPVAYLPTASLTGTAFVLIVGICWFRAPDAQRPPDHHTLGAANRVTLIRGTLVCIAAAFVPFSHYAAQHAWVIAWISLIALIMDGIDGATARRTQSSSAFGARFDMELDAALMLVLCALLVTQGKVGAWALAIGLMRYLFVVAGWLLPRLKAPLPASRLRKTVCVWQLVTLMVCLLPWISGALASAFLGIALALLVYSFGRDSLWLLTRRHSKEIAQ
ncbi:CDP-alcohol phosphatidyltransferase family protein [Marinobacter halodurans]|uniref:CDP-alcohol phosphatidyltransferase family protein n=1 Tax=Marinobacter halodurans TaxID=2528979 RepID=A0ABY1ZKX9_9GAMM|nr:CDP-alcohol phosphatidyltransferase family protein [Marinobacter halodurans]TBW51548.1 CDP-alcohol phosphatidyltransferase family protein [Marinobacter halodurans]